MDRFRSIQHFSPVDVGHPAFQSYGTHSRIYSCTWIMLCNPTSIRMSRSISGRGCGWELFQIERWIKETGRMVLGGVARNGKVYVLHVADDPNDPKPWSPGAPKSSPWNRTPDNRRDLARLVMGIAFDPTRFGNQLMLAMRLLEWPALVGCNTPTRIAPPTPAPAINDSS